MKEMNEASESVYRFDRRDVFLGTAEHRDLMPILSSKKSLAGLFLSESRWLSMRFPAAADLCRLVHTRFHKNKIHGKDVVFSRSAISGCLNCEMICVLSFNIKLNLSILGSYLIFNSIFG